MKPAPASAFFGRPRFRISEAQAVVEQRFRRHRFPCRTSFLALNQFEPKARYSAPKSLKIPALHLERFDMEIRHEHIPWDDRLRPVA